MTRGIGTQCGAVAALALVLPTVARAGFTGLGDLPGGNFFSQATKVSPDGSFVVGHSSSAASGPGSNEAFRWTAAGGMVGLGDLPGGGFSSNGYGVSANGSVVVGYGNSASGQE